MNLKNLALLLALSGSFVANVAAMHDSEETLSEDEFGEEVSEETLALIDAMMVEDLDDAPAAPAPQPGERRAREQDVQQPEHDRRVRPRLDAANPSTPLRDGSCPFDWLGRDGHSLILQHLGLADRFLLGRTCRVFKTALNNHVDRLKEAIAAIQDPAAALFTAIENGNIEQVWLLAFHHPESKTIVNSLHPAKATPLVCAIDKCPEASLTPIVKILLQAGADVNVRVHYRYTAQAFPKAPLYIAMQKSAELSWSSRENNITRVLLLLRKNHNLEHLDEALRAAKHFSGANSYYRRFIPQLEAARTEAPFARQVVAGIQSVIRSIKKEFLLIPSYDI